MGVRMKATPLAAVAGATRKVAFKRARKGGNLSRKQILLLQRTAAAPKLMQQEAARKEAKKKATEAAQRRNNKKTNRTFDRQELQCVQDGLVAAIELLGTEPSPLSLFMCATTALSKTADSRQIPYLLTIMSACLARVTQGFLQSQLQSVFALLEQVIAEHASSNNLVMAKAMKLAQQYLLHMEQPTMNALDKGLRRLEPSKQNPSAMSMYLITWRKFLESAALYSSGASLRPQKDANGEYVLPERTLLFVEALPKFADLCISCFTDAPFAVAARATEELKALMQRAISPYIVESAAGRDSLNAVISAHLLNLFKAHYQAFWPLAAELVETLFDRLSYLKRTKHAANFTTWFPNAAFIVKVLNKLRHLEDSKLNGKVERAMVAIGKGMPMSVFTELVPFDPREIHRQEQQLSVADAKEYEQQVGELWANSYILGVVRRTASHDSLPFFVRHYGPIIQYCMRMATESERSKNAEVHIKWSALVLQYWRVCVGFCHYPLEITKDSFRDVAKQLVGLLSQSHYVDTAATALHVLCDGYYNLSKVPSQDDEQEDDIDREVPVPQEVLADDERPTFPSGSRRRLEKNNLEDDDGYLSLNDPTWNPHKYHNISQAVAKDVCDTVLAAYSSNIMPKLCNTFETHDSTAVLLAIQSYSKVCTVDVMKVILQGILNVGVNISREGRERVEISEAAAKTSSQPLNSKRRMILDLACAVVGQITPEQLNTLFDDIVEPVLTDPAPESRLLQKKAYKLLFSMFEVRVKDLFELFPRIASLLVVGQRYVTVSGVRMRVRCLSWALDACKMYNPEKIGEVIRGSISEVILFSRERSSGARELAMEMLEKMQRYLVSGGGSVSTLLHLVLAALSGKTPMMLSCALVCMAKVMHMTHHELPEKDLTAAVSIGYKMIESTEPEVRSAAATLARMTLKLMKRSPAMRKAVLAALPKLLYGIALVTSQPHVSSGVRLQMRVLLSKCIKRFSYEKIDVMFPLGSKRFLAYTDKLMRREERKKDYEQRKRAAGDSNEFDKLFLGTTIKAAAAAGDSGDLLQEGGLSHFIATHTEAEAAGRGRAARPGGNSDDDEEEDDRMHLEFVKGKLRIMTHEEKRLEVEKERRQEMAERLLRRNKGLLDPTSLNDQSNSTRAKRGRDDEEDFANDELVLRYGSKLQDGAVASAAAKFKSATKARATGGGAGATGVTNHVTKLRDQKESKRELKRQRVEGDIRKGEEFTGKGFGDIKKGSVDPFAYVPLNRQFMNRRHQRLALQRFQAVSQSALKGNKAKLLTAQMKRKAS